MAVWEVEAINVKAPKGTCQRLTRLTSDYALTEDEDQCIEAMKMVDLSLDFCEIELQWADTFEVRKKLDLSLFEYFNQFPIMRHPFGYK